MNLYEELAGLIGEIIEEEHIPWRHLHLFEYSKAPVTESRWRRKMNATLLSKSQTAWQGSSAYMYEENMCTTHSALIGRDCECLKDQEDWPTRIHKIYTFNVPTRHSCPQDTAYRKVSVHNCLLLCYGYHSSQLLDCICCCLSPQNLAIYNYMDMANALKSYLAWCFSYCLPKKKGRSEAWTLLFSQGPFDPTACSCIHMYCMYMY